MSCEKRKSNDQEQDSNDSYKFQDGNNARKSSNNDKLIVEKKIRKIIESHFDEEINYKKYELDKINEVI